MAQSNTILLLCKDLMTRTRLKQVCATAGVACRWVKDSADLLQADPSSSIVVLSLAELMEESDEQLRALASKLSSEKTVCFYPHVESELARRALNCGFTGLVTRSKVDQRLQEIILAAQSKTSPAPRHGI